MTSRLVTPTTRSVRDTYVKELRDQQDYTRGHAIQLTSCMAIPVLLGTLTPLDSTIEVEVDVQALQIEPAGGHTSWFFYYGPTGAGQLTPTLWQGGDAQPNNPVVAGAAMVRLGVQSWAGGPTQRFKLSGLTPGVPIAWEVSCLITGGFRQKAVPNTPFSIGLSTKYDEEQQFWGAWRYADTGGIQIFKSRHWQGYFEETTVGNVLVPANAVAGFGQVRMTPDGKYAVVTTQSASVAANRVCVISTGAPVGLAPAGVPAIDGYVDPGFPPSAIAISPDGVYAWIAMPSPAGGGTPGKIRRMKISDRTLGTILNLTAGLGDAGSKYGRGSIVMSPAGDFLYVCNEGSKTISKVTTTEPPTLSATLAAQANAPVVAAISPDGAWLYALDRAATPKMYKIRTSDMTVQATANMTPGTQPYAVQMFPDGKCLLYLGDVNSSGFGIRQIQQINIPAMTKVAELPNGRQSDPTQFDAAYDLVISPYGSIHVVNDVGKCINNWPGGMMFMEDSSYHLHGIRVLATPATS